MGCDRLEISPEDGGSSLRFSLFTHCHQLLPAALSPLREVGSLGTQRRVETVAGIDVGVVIEAIEDPRFEVVHEAGEVFRMC